MFPALWYTRYQCSKLTFESGPVGLKFTGPSAKLLITLIIFKFFYMYTICLQVNKWNCNQINPTIVFISLYIAAKTIVLQYDFSVLMCFQAVCLQIICSDPQGWWEYCVFFVVRNSLKNAQNILFSCPSNLSHLYLSSHASRNLCVFFGWSRCFRCYVNFFIICWLLSFKGRLQWALHLFPFWHNLAHVLIHQKKIDTDLRNEKPPSCIQQCILFQVEPRLSFGKRMPSTFCLFVFETFAFGNSSLICFKVFSSYWYDTKKLHVFLTEWLLFLSRGLVGQKNTHFQNFLLVLDEWMTVKFEHWMRWLYMSISGCFQPSY